MGKKDEMKQNEINLLCNNRIIVYVCFFSMLISTIQAQDNLPDQKHTYQRIEYAQNATRLKHLLQMQQVSTIRISDIRGWCEGGCTQIYVNRDLVIGAENLDQGSLLSLAQVPQSMLIIEGNSTVIIRKITMIDTDLQASFQKDVIFPVFFYVNPLGTLIFEQCTFVDTSKEPSSIAFKQEMLTFYGGTSRQVPSAQGYNSSRKAVIEYWEANSSVLESLSGVSAFPIKPGTIVYKNTAVVADVADCYEGGIIAANSDELIKYLKNDNIFRIYMVDNIVMRFEQFPNMGIDGIEIVDRNLTLFGCSNVLWDLNFLDMSIFIRGDSHVSVEGGMTISNSKAIARNFWPELFFPFMAFFQLEHGSNNSLTLKDVTIKGIVDNPLFNPSEQSFWQVDSSVLPAIDYARLTADEVVVMSWNLSRREWIQQVYPEDSFVNQFDVLKDGAVWNMQNVTIIKEQWLCSPGLQYHFVDTPGKLRAALSDQQVSNIALDGDVVIYEGDWPRANKQPEEGINITRRVTITNCRSTQITWDLNSLDQTIYVQSGGYLRIEGDILFTNSLELPRRDFNYILLSFFSVEQDGILELNNVTIRGSKPSLFHPNQNLNLPPSMVPAPPLILLSPDSSNTVILKDWILLKAAFVQFKTGVISRDLGYWHFIQTKIDYIS